MKSNLISEHLHDKDELLNEQITKLKQELSLYKYIVGKLLNQRNAYPFDTTTLNDDQRSLFNTIIDDEFNLNKGEIEFGLFRNIVETSREAISITNAEGQFLYANPAHIQLFKRPVDVLLQENYRDHYPPESLALMDASTTFVGEIDVYDAEGRRFPIWQSNMTVKDQNGNILFGFAIMRDISEQKLAEEQLLASEARFRAAAEGRLDAFFVLRVVDRNPGEVKDFLIIEINSHAEELIGKPRSEIIGKSIFQVLYGPWAKMLAERSTEAIEARSTIDEEFQMDYIGGDKRWYHHQIIMLPDGVAVSHRDITDKKRDDKKKLIQEERKRLARDLHDSVTQSVYSLNLFAGGWRKMVSQATSKEIEAWFKRVEDISQQVLKELRLLLFELRTGDEVQKNFYRDITNRLKAVEERSGIKTSLKIDRDIYLKPFIEDQFIKIVFEALNNSLKHSRASNISIRMYQVDQMITLDVADDGCGFDITKGEEHSGLGLSIIKERTITIGGQLKILTSPGKGFRIQVTIPS